LETKAKKKILVPPNRQAMHALWIDAYERNNYADKTLSARILSGTHTLIEKDFPSSVFFKDVIEVGAGSGAHLRAVRHKFDNYVMCDASIEILQTVQISEDLSGKVETHQADAAALPYPDDSFDRLIATYVLEHLARPQEVLQEWARVVRPGGILSIVLPCDPSLLWRLGRFFGPRKAGEKAGLPYDYYMAVEHINPIHNLEIIIDAIFPEKRVRWWPFNFMPIHDVNLIYAANISI
jgi:phosphatidylethanolamine/phosphatidyl-N-methylethanolamine N-methyltransferase